MTGKRILIVSPQAGMCNRFRVMASCAAMADHFGYELSHTWNGNEPLVDGEKPHVAEAKRQSFASLVGEIGEEGKDFNLSRVDTSAVAQMNFDLVLTEWGADSFWGKYQHTPVKAAQVVVTGNPWKVLHELGGAPKTVFVQTSLACNNPFATDSQNVLLRNKFYKQLGLTPLLRPVINRVGIHIRHGDLAELYPSVRCTPGNLKMMTQMLTDSSLDAVVISDDPEIRKTCVFPAREIRKTCVFLSAQEFRKTCVFPPAIEEFKTLLTCSAVVGTRHSSFGREAAAITGVPYTDDQTKAGIAGIISALKRRPVRIVVIIASHEMEKYSLPNIARLKEQVDKWAALGHSVDVASVSSRDDHANYEGAIGQFKYKHENPKRQLGKICDFVTNCPEKYDWYIKFRPNALLLDDINLDAMAPDAINARLRCYTGYRSIEYGATVGGEGNWKDNRDANNYCKDNDYMVLDDQLFIFGRKVVEAGVFKPLSRGEDNEFHNEWFHTRIWLERGAKLNPVGLNINLLIRNFYFKSGHVNYPPPIGIIISPQSGSLELRSRTLCSYALAARQLAVNFYQYWGRDEGPDIRNDLQKKSFDDLYEASDAFPPADRSRFAKVQTCFSEWPVGHFWHGSQSSAQRHWAIVPKATGADAAEMLMLGHTLGIALFETSVPIRIAAERGGCETDAEYEAALADIARCLVAKRN